MDIFEELNKYKNIENEKKIDFSDLLSDTTSFLQGEVPPKMKTSEYLKSAVSWVYAASIAIADEVGTINIKQFKKKGDDIEEVKESPILNLLSRVNDFTTKFNFFRLISQYLDLAGEAPIFLSYENNEPVSMILLRPDKLKILIAKDNKKNSILKGYKYRIGVSDEISLSPKELILLRLPDPANQFRGKGPLEAAALTVDVDTFSEEYNRKFFYNSGRPDSILRTDKSLTKDQREYLEKKIKQKYTGLPNAHKTMILEKGLDWKPMALTQKDMDFLEQQKFTRDKILGIFKVPKSILGLTEDVNRANAETAAYTFARWTIKPRMQQIIEQLNEFLLPLFPNTEDQFLDYTDPVPENRELQLKENESGLKAGYLTINEVRQKEGLEGIGPAGDKIYLPMNIIPIDSVGSNDNAKRFNHHPDFITQSNRRISSKSKKDKQVEDYKKDIKDEVAEKLIPIIESILSNGESKEVDIKSPACRIKNESKKECVARKIPELIREGRTQDQAVAIANSICSKKCSDKKDEHVDKRKMIFEKALRRFHGRFENLMMDKINKQFDEQSKEIVNRLNKKQLDPNNFLLDQEKQAKIAVELYLPIEAETITEQSRLAFDFIGLTDNLTTDNPAVRKFLKETILKFSFEMTKTTNRKVKKVLQDGIREGFGIDKLARGIRKLFTGMKTYRSKRIARTEITRATSFAAEQSYKESGVVESKEWITAFDERTCPYCEAMNGKTINLGKNYFNKGDHLSKLTFDYESIKFPPLHANCRCTLIPVIK